MDFSDDFSPSPGESSDSDAYMPDSGSRVRKSAANGRKTASSSMASTASSHNRASAKAPCANGATSGAKRGRPAASRILAETGSRSFSSSPSDFANNLNAKAVGNIDGLESAGADSLTNNQNETGSMGSASTAQVSKSEYQRLTPREHVLRRPDTYVGSIEMSAQQMWVYDTKSQSMTFRTVNLVPGLYKIFDEIMVNAADNKIRDSGMDVIKVEIDSDANTVSVFNNGRGIPIEIHPKEKIWTPELIFGHLLTSSNYDDNEKKVTGGRNGYGAKLCNIFSTEFILETADEQQKYKQVWRDNMARKLEPRITDNKKGGQFTKITFKPDLARFGMEFMDEDLKAVLARRVYDLAGCVRDVKVYLNGERIKIKNFKQYVELYTRAALQNDVSSKATEESQTHANENNGAGEQSLGNFSVDSLPEPAPAVTLPAKVQEKSPIVHEIFNDRWEIAFAASDGEFKQVSFVNNIATTRGGTHVNYIADQITGKLVEIVKKKNKAGMKLKPFQIKNHLWIFVNCLIENPTFDSQTKETLTLKQSSFGSKCAIRDDFVKKILKTGVLENILSFAEYKADQAMKKSDGKSRSRITGLPKLEDANHAGTKNGYKCTLILTEGDSAKTSAVSGLSVVGRDYFGVFPLRGKLLNVREASHEQIMKNAEIQAIKKIMGLAHNKSYTSTTELRYGHLMIMADQDLDGSHIKGLIINYLETFFPSLLQIPGFLLEFITPIVRVSKGSQTIDFFTVPEFEYWKESNNDAKGWKIKYYKGLGTSGSADVQKYFSDLDKHLKEFHEIQDGDRELIDLAFSKKKADNRKDWLRNFVPGTYMDHSQPKIPISDFINKELILFSLADNVRAIPSMIDGLKPSQRKVIYACFKRKLKEEIKVAQLSGFVSQHTAYHHGENNLMQTIVGLAQSFVGSNNINLLEPLGQFGSRLQGGKDSASPRYIFTNLSKLTRKIIRTEDDYLLTYLNDDGQDIEPEYYVPILPLVLINGSEGIGTGWSSFIPNFNPKDVVGNLKRMMNDESPLPMHPWYRGFAGEITPQGSEKYKVSGKIQQIDDRTIEITELPIRFWTQDMKEFLEEATVGTDKCPAFIKDYQEYHTESKVHFVIKLTEKGIAQSLAEGLENKFKLSRTISMTNMVAFDPECRINRYNSVEEILIQFYHVRLEFYHKRKTYMLKEIEKQLEKLSNQARFIRMIVDEKLVVSKKKKATLVDELHALSFKPIVAELKNKAAQLDVDNEAVEDADSFASGFDYLLSMPIHSLTAERFAKLMATHAAKEEELTKLTNLSVKDMWCHDLDEFIQEWEVALESDRQLAMQPTRLKQQRGKEGKKRTKKNNDEEEWGTQNKRAAKSNKVNELSSVTSLIDRGPANVSKPVPPKGNIANYGTLSKKASVESTQANGNSMNGNSGSLNANLPAFSNGLPTTNGHSKPTSQNRLNHSNTVKPAVADVDDYLKNILMENSEKLRASLPDQKENVLSDMGNSGDDQNSSHVQDSDPTITKSRGRRAATAKKYTIDSDSEIGEDTSFAVSDAESDD